MTSTEKRDYLTHTLNEIICIEMEKPNNKRAHHISTCIKNIIYELAGDNAEFDKADCAALVDIYRNMAL